MLDIAIVLKKIPMAHTNAPNAALGNGVPLQATMKASIDARLSWGRLAGAAAAPAPAPDLHDGLEPLDQHGLRSALDERGSLALDQVLLDQHLGQRV